MTKTMITNTAPFDAKKTAETIANAVAKAVLDALNDATARAEAHPKDGDQTVANKRFGPGNGTAAGLAAFKLPKSED